ncbi:MAG TPA: HAD family phosphatase, partial [Dehalococcoidia bacterium]|nr:HAD family phosphatase [Dehalococcoidia bacterium]
LDGVLWDGEPLYYQAMNDVLREYGYQLDFDEYQGLIGHGVEPCWQWLRQRFSLAEPLELLLEAYDRAVMRILDRSVEPLPGVRKLMRELSERKVPFGLASSSLRPWVEAILRGLSLENAVSTTVAGNEVDNAKPAPDIYLEAAARLGVHPRDCLAIEDTPSGIAAAKAAGMFAVQVRSASTAFPPLPEADLVLSSLCKFDLSLLRTGRS